ncbi:MAG: transglutaminase-like cysteine peptidase [Pelagibacteraceae bacterium]
MGTGEILFIVGFVIVSYLWYEKKRKKIVKKAKQIRDYKVSQFVSLINKILQSAPTTIFDPPTINNLVDIHNLVHNRFIYKDDFENYGVFDDWRSHAQEVIEGQTFEDDCDGFAFTVCELLIQEGFSPDQVLFLSCTVETGEGHAVAACIIDGNIYVADSRKKSIYEFRHAAFSKYIFESYVKLSAPEELIYIG